MTTQPRQATQPATQPATQNEAQHAVGPAPDDPTRLREPAAADAPMAPPPKVRRRPMLWAVGLALIALGGLGAAYVATAVSDTQKVIVMRNDVDRGALITAQDLTTAQISADPALQPIAAADAGQVIGKRASRDLNAGSLVSRSAIATQVIPAPGQSLVGVAVTPAQLPASSVRAGDKVRVVFTPRAQDQFGTARAPSFDATVVGLRKVRDTGQYVVDVTLPSVDAADLAQLVATARIALVVDGGK